ncbi:hypothetical protein KCH_16560 [Kitasatospora cheerisanensis KCTC 2395]|uniref:Uncharacterized protein n=1 Tax=Kitasatospora cheerisanensis KCTC 2395 TaxID=1348663 RepID=A0A066Z8Q3_9ACTN|nr:hypothetical protein KCH_16560 [Kitasatospora cheerisanensis KCTC 2395]
MGPCRGGWRARRRAGVTTVLLLSGAAVRRCTCFGAGGAVPLLPSGDGGAVPLLR